MAWRVSTAPDDEPVSLAEAKLHLRVDMTDDDDLITGLITAAREWSEGYQNRAYITQTITLTLDEFPETFELPQAPLISVTSIKYIDTAGVQQTLSTDVYDVDTESEPGRVALAYSQCWPTIRGDINSVEVIFQAGYGDAGADVPASVKSAMKLLIGHLYEHREMVSEIKTTEVPMTVKSLLGMDRMVVV